MSDIILSYAFLLGFTDLGDAKQLARKQYIEIESRRLRYIDL